MYHRGSVRVMGERWGSLRVIWLASAVACAGASGEDSSPAPPPAPAASGAVASGAGGGSPSRPEQSSSPDAPASPVSAESSPASPNTPIDPSSTDPAPVAQGSGVDACSVLGDADACGACVCSECRSELDACLAVPGCAEILACVRESGCTGRDCYCGDASLTECVRGEANGPCQEAVLAAPGGRAPSVTDPSGGPASDAALSVSDCADEGDTCQDVCSLRQ